MPKAGAPPPNAPCDLASQVRKIMPNASDTPSQRPLRPCVAGAKDYAKCQRQRLNNGVEERRLDPSTRVIIFCSCGVRLRNATARQVNPQGASPPTTFTPDNPDD
jgi:hypothetical protein